MSCPLQVREALASVAASHEADCDCVTCRGAHGDERAVAEILDAVAEIEQAEAGAPMSRYVWELVRCTNPECAYEHTRHAAGKLALACHRCRSEMEIIPLQTPAGVAQRFGPGAMREALRWATESELGKSLRTDDAVEKARHVGRAEAFDECLDMLVATGRQGPISGSGVIGDRSFGRGELSVGDRLRTENITAVLSTAAEASA